MFALNLSPSSCLGEPFLNFCANSQNFSKYLLIFRASLCQINPNLELSFSSSLTKKKVLNESISEQCKFYRRLHSRDSEGCLHYTAIGGAPPNGDFYAKGLLESAIKNHTRKAVTKQDWKEEVEL